MAQIKVSLDYYDATQSALFQGFPNHGQLNHLVANGLIVSRDEFLSYMMFTEQMDRDGFRTYADLQARIERRLGDIDDFLTFNNSSVQSKMSALEMMQPGFTERIGVALGLCVINKIHNLTAADWKKVPETRGRNAKPTFDFEIPVASTGDNFIQTENKGSIVGDNALQTVGVQNHYRGIQEKKFYVRAQESSKGLSVHANLYYGTIGVLDTRVNSLAKVWLVDPPAFDVDMNARKYKLLARLNFYLDEFRSIGVKKRIINALERRIEEIQASEDFMAFNNRKLDESFPSGSGEYLYMEGSIFASVDTNEAFGKVFLVDFRNRIVPYLIAYPKSLIRLIIRQDFDAILSYGYNPDFMDDKVQVFMRFSKADMMAEQLSEKLNFTFSEQKRFYQAVYFGRVNHSLDGRIFGVLDNEVPL